MGIRREIQHQSGNEDNSISFEEALKKMAESTKENQKKEEQKKKEPPEKETEENEDDKNKGKQQP